MRIVVQRVSSASVSFFEGDIKITNSIEKGLQVLLGVTDTDTTKDIDYLVDKVIGLRIFEDDEEKMNLSLKDIGGELLLVSQFTLYGDVRKGKRPSFSTAAKPEYANELYELFVEKVRKAGIKCETGKFGADMKLLINNDGPVTILLDSQKIF